ncbi:MULTISPECIES: hypothetical protein [unclassified Duganella]|uniref:hypothetical protein n=1 Tax=unclassified Duganella TaxID=2636909 RepID=UPI00088FA53C|nr:MULTISPECIES: hypothetical protein [unclassified Duganella]SDH36971.1 hypothetical protein SAMN05216320_112165 [Duganella sp. OV458]SDK53339.1 hypothetical protein SAMN05428973_112165 [Duganella sp. OV510]
MRRAIGQYLRIDVAPHAVSVQRASRWRLPGRAGAPADTLATQAIAPSADHPFDAIANAMRTLLGELDVAGWPVSMVVADELARMWRVTPPSGAARLADLEAAAGLRFQALYGESLSAWQLAADWSATQPFFAAAMPRALLAALSVAVNECKLSVVAIEPRFVHAWNRSRRGLKQGAWYGHVHDNLLTLAATEADSKRLRAIRPLPVPHGADHQWLTQTLQREALLLDMEAPALLQVSGSAPAAWTKPVSSAAHIPCTLVGSAA